MRRRWRRPLCSAAFALALAAASAALGQTSGVPELPPVPSALLQGNTLVLQSWNCSVAPPGDGWIWTKPNLKLDPKTRSEAFVCLESATDVRIVFTLTEAGGGQINEKYVEALVAGIRRSFEKQHAQLTNVRQAPSAVPLPTSYRLWGDYATADGTKLKWHCYVSTAGPAYVFQAFSLEETESPEFRRLVSSFRLLHPLQPKPQPARPAADLMNGVLTVVSCLVVLAFWGLGALVNKLIGRPAVNGAAGGGIFVALGVIVLMVYTAFQPGFDKLDSFKQGEAIGRFVGLALIPVLLAFFLGRHFAKKKRELLKLPPPIR
jgi:hypothetical protein